MWEIQPSVKGWRVRNLLTGKTVIEDVSFTQAFKTKLALDRNALTRAASIAAGN